MHQAPGIVVINSFDEINAVNVKGILLDIDNTLYNYTPTHEYALKKTLKLIKRKYAITGEATLELYKESRGGINKELKNQASSHSRLLYFQRMTEKISGRTDPGFSLEMEKYYWDSFIDKIKIRKDAMTFLKSCKGKKVCIVTDLTAQIQFQKILRKGLAKYIDFIVTSEEAGIEKPDTRVFDLALKKIKTKPAETIMIGDSEEKDGGALSSGIKTYILK